MNGKAQAQHQPEASTSSALPPPPNDPTNPALAKRPRVSGPRPSTFKPDSIPPQRPKQPVTFSPFNTFAPTPSTSTPKRPMSALMPLPPPLSVAPLAIAAAKPSRLPVSGRAEVKGKGKGKAPFSSVLGQKPPTPSVPPHKKPRLLQPFDTFAPESPITSKKKPNLQPLPSFALPATTSTPKRKPLATPPRPPSLLRANESVRPVGTPVSERASTLFGSLMVKKEEPVGKRLLESVPPAPKGGTDWDMLDDEGGAMQWSPRKKNAKYTLGGLASRTSSLIASARTDQTLWLHNLSRLLATHQQSSSPPLSKALLAKVAQPAVRFLVLETLPLRTTPPGTVRYRDASKTVLTRCRLLLDPTEKAADAPSSSPSQPSSAESELPPDEEYLTGLVLFSLHLHPPSASLHPSAALPRKKPVADGGAASLFLPTNPHDLRFIAAGAEVWVWEEGMEEVSLPFQGPRRLLPPMREERASRVHAEEGEEGEVYWDSRPVEELERERAEKRRKEEEEDGRKKALVCERFGVVGPLPDESKASSASLLIKRFQAQISSDEPPLVPSSSFGSPGRPRNSLIAPPGGASIGVRLDETRKSLEGSRKDFFEKIPLDDNGGVRPWLKSTSTAAAATSLPPESQAGEGRAAPVPIVTRPSVDVPVPALTTLDGSDFGGLPAKEGLSRPTSPLVQSGRLSAPPPTDDNSPPPSPIFGSSPSIVVPDSAPLPFPTSSPPHSEARSSPPNTATSRQQPTRPARTGSVHIPTTASLLKTKPRVSNSSSPSTPRAVSPATSTRSRTTSRVSTPHLASPPLPSSTKMSPSSSRSSLGISSFAGGSPSLSSSTTTRRPRSNSNASAVSTATTVGGTPRKAAVPTTGTPRSRAAAAAAAALAAGGEVPAVPTTPARKSATSTRTPVKTPSSVTPAKARTPVVATKVFPTAVRTTPSAVGRASTSSTSATRGSTASVRGARGASTAATRGGAAKKLTSEPRVVVKVPPSDPVVSGVEAKKPDGEVETGGEGTEGPAATPSDDVAALSVVGGENDAPADGKSEKIHHVTSPSDALVSSEIGEGSAAGGSEAGAGAEVELELEETAPGIEEAAPGVKEYAPGFEDAAEDEKHTHSVEPSDSEDFPDIPDDNGEDLGTEVGGAEEKVFAGIGEKPVGKVGMEVVEDGEGGIVAVGAELLETASA